MDTELIAEIELPGFLPPRQERSRKVVADLVSGALRLLRDKDFTELSIVDFCAEAGVTTGAFYKRFPGKELFVEFLQRLVVEEMRRGIDTRLTVEQWRDIPLDQFVRKTVGATVRWYQRYEGFVRASLRHAQMHPDSWSPMRDTGARYSRAIEPIIAAIVGGQHARAAREAVPFAVQCLLGTLNSMVLIDPGPCRLHDAQTVKRLANAVTVLVAPAALGPAARTKTRSQTVTR